MITYCASDIIRQAKIVGKVSNINMTNFELCNSLLNSEYQKLYDRVVMANGANLKEEHFITDGPFDIPEDCYHIIGVYSGNKLLSKSSPRQYIKGQYRIENNKILFDGFGPVDAWIKYSTLPQTLTAPDVPEEIKEDVAEVGLVTDKGFYFKDNSGAEKYYDFSSQESVEKLFKSAPNRFLDGALEFDGETITLDSTPFIQNARTYVPVRFISEALGANVEVSNGNITAKARKLTANSIYMDVVSVGATINVMLASVLAEGTSIIDNADSK